MGLGQVSTVDVPTRWSCASSKTSWQTGRCVPARCLGEEPIPHFRSSSSHPFMKVCQNRVNGLTFRYQIHVNNPSDIEKKIIVVLNLDLLCRAFSCLGELRLLHCMDCRLLCVSYWKNHDSSQIITFSIMFGPFSLLWRMLAQMFIRISFCSGVSSLGTIFEHAFSSWNCNVKSVEQFPCQCQLTQQLLEYSGDEFVEQFHRLFRC